MAYHIRADRSKVNLVRQIKNVCKHFSTQWTAPPTLIETEQGGVQAVAGVEDEAPSLEVGPLPGFSLAVRRIERVLVVDGRLGLPGQFV